MRMYRLIFRCAETFPFSFYFSPGQLVHPGLSTTLLLYSKQVSLGMRYLSCKSFVHRDLAARNVLLTNDLVCKVHACRKLHYNASGLQHS